MTRAIAGLGLLAAFAVAAPPEVAAVVPSLAAPPSVPVQRDKGQGLEVRFVSYPWRPDVFHDFEEGSATAHAWAFARLLVSSPFAMDGVRLYPGQYAMVLDPKTGGLPLSLELRRVGGAEFLVDPPAMAPPPPGETAYKRPAEFAASTELAPALDLTVASFGGGSLLTIRYGNRKLVKELAREAPY